MLDAGGNIYGTTTFGGESNQGVFFEVVGPSDTGRYKEKIKLNFNGPDGSEPLGSLIQDSAGNFYGTASVGGTGAGYGGGVVFEVTP